MNGANLPAEFNDVGALFDGTESLTQNFLKLSYGRIDCVVSLKGLGDACLSEEKITGIVSGPPLLTVYGGYSAQKTAEGRELSSLIDSAVESMVEDGAYQRIMANSGASVY